jgi:flagellar protein FliS
MSTLNNQLAYQEAAVRNAGPVDLIIIVYDVLARDLQKAIVAMDAGDIEARSRHIKHGFLALQQLEGTLDMEQGGDLATNMARFYTMLRGQMMKAQIEQDPAVLRELIQLVFSVREAWVEAKTKQTPAESQPSRPSQISPYDQPETRSASWNG